MCNIKTLPQPEIWQTTVGKVIYQVCDSWDCDLCYGSGEPHLILHLTQSGSPPYPTTSTSLHPSFTPPPSHPLPQSIPTSFPISSYFLPISSLTSLLPHPLLHPYVIHPTSPPPHLSPHPPSHSMFLIPSPPPLLPPTSPTPSPISSPTLPCLTPPHPPHPILFPLATSSPTSPTSSLHPILHLNYPPGHCTKPLFLTPIYLPNKLIVHLNNEV